MLRDGWTLRLREGSLRGLDEDGREASVSGGAECRGESYRRAGDELPGADPGRHRRIRHPPCGISGRLPQERRLSVAVAFSDSEALLFAFHDELLLTGREDGGSVPVLSSIEDLGLNVIFQQEVGVLRGKRCFAAEVAGGDAAPNGYVFRDLRGLWGGDEDFFRVAGKAKQIVAW